MKKKNLIVLLLLPFVIATLCIVTVNITYDAVDVDISSIKWDYDDFEPFKLSDGALYKLVATGVNRNNYKLADGNELVWSVENKNGEEEVFAEITEQNGDFYLKPIKEGEIIITCSNQKGNVSRRMTGVIYENSVILLQPKIGGSQNNIDSKIYYGQYDLSSGSKTSAVIDMKITAIPSSILSTIKATCSENISFDLSSEKISILNCGSASLVLESTAGSSATFSFEIVENGVNVYSYEDLLNCTNRSKEGEIVVLRKHFESLDNAYVQSGTSLTKKSTNVECFGNYNSNNKTYNFKNEIYSFATTYNDNYISQWNEFARSNSKYSEVSNKVKVGIRVQKDFYGNGYTLNFHNLTFPYGHEEGESGQSIPKLTSENLFRGPLHFYTLGDPNSLYLIAALGQDNIGLYVDGDDITVNDVVVKNCDFGDRVANLDTVGTVMEIGGNNVTVKNSRLSNGKHVVRAFSSMNLTLKNCMLSQARNFLFFTGSNEYASVNGEEIYNGLVEESGATLSGTVGDYLAFGGAGDTALNNFLVNDYSTDANARNAVKKVIKKVQEILTDKRKVEGKFKGTTVIEDCLFGTCGISAIGVESLFNGPFLYCASPTSISTNIPNPQIASLFKTLIPYMATDVAGASYPVKVEVKGETCFYDYKTREQFDLSGLITENISTILNSIGFTANISIDDIFPLKSMLMQNAYGYIHTSNGKSYVNVPVAYYGGGLNLSEVKFVSEESRYSAKVNVDLLEYYLNMKGGTGNLEAANIENVMLKTVTTVIGYEPFGFHFVEDGYLYGETPKDSQLIANAKGEN